MERIQYTGPWSDIKVEERGIDLGVVRVPFSQQELETIKSLREIRDGWTKEAVKGSGWTRELWVICAYIPWAHMLKDREEAFEGMRRILYKIIEVRAKAKERKIQEVANLAKDLDAIEEGLLQFLPEERKPNQRDKD